MPDFDLSRVVKELQKMASSQFYGEMQVKFVSGKIVQCKRIESLAPDSTDRRISLNDSST